MTAGIALIVIGLLAVLSQTIATFATVVVLGWLVFVAGIAQIAGAFMARGVGQVILLLLVGVLDIVVGLMLVQHPVAGAVTITLLLAALLVFGGVYRFIAALWLKFPQYGMAAISGAISVYFGPHALEPMAVFRVLVPGVCRRCELHLRAGLGVHSRP